MIRFAQNNDLEQLKNLWKIAFPEDSMDFIHFYFSQKNNPKRTLVQDYDGKIVAMMEMIPYKMTFFDKLVDVYYISGANTLPAFQGQGLMSNLIKQSFQIAYQQGYACAVLFPQNEATIKFYKQFDFEQIFEYQKYTPCIKPLYLPIETLTDKNLLEAYHFFNNQTLKRNFCIQKTMDDFRTIVQDCYLSNGTPFLLRKNNKIVSMAFCYLCKKLIIKDILHNSIFDKEQLLSAIAHFYHTEKMQMIEPNCNPSENPSFSWGMLRVINYRQLADISARHQPKASSFCFHDNFIAENNGYWGTKQNDVLSFKHSDFCDFLFKNQPQKPFMNLMLD